MAIMTNKTTTISSPIFTTSGVLPIHLWVASGKMCYSKSGHQMRRMQVCRAAMFPFISPKADLVTTCICVAVRKSSYLVADCMTPCPYCDTLSLRRSASVLSPNCVLLLSLIKGCSVPAAA